MNRCTICGTTEGLTWCGMCQKWLCPPCKANIPKRAVAAAGETVGKILSMAGLR